MDSKPLIYGIIGFILGGLLVSVVATTGLGDPAARRSGGHQDAAATRLQDLTGDAFDKAFLNEMIIHHEGAITMARQAETNAKHTEIKQLSQEIIQSQQKEIERMQQWQSAWGYERHTSGH